jgi:hypothetical protein
MRWMGGTRRGEFKLGDGGYGGVKFNFQDARAGCGLHPIGLAMQSNLLKNILERSDGRLGKD